MDILQLRIFLILAETCNFNKTAVAAHITQPAVSYHMRNLEEELGVGLFKRNRYRTELTTAGKELVPYARGICEQEFLARERMKNIKNGTAGRITVGAIQTYLPELSEAAAAYSKEYPEVQIDISMMDGPEIKTSHTFCEYDIYLCIDNMLSDNPLYRNEKLREDPMELYYPVSFADRIDPENWSGMEELPFISIIEYNYFLYQRVLSLMDKHRFSPRRVHHTTSVESILYMVDAGFGISILPAGYRKGKRYPSMLSQSICDEEALLPMMVSWKDEAGNAALHNFADMLRTKAIYQLAPMRMQ